VGLRPAHRSGPPSRNRTRATPRSSGWSTIRRKSPIPTRAPGDAKLPLQGRLPRWQTPRGAIVAKLEATLDAACRRVKFPIGNFGEVAGTLFARERFDAASARNAGTLRERRHHSFTLWRSQFGCRTDSRLQTSRQRYARKPIYTCAALSVAKSQRFRPAVMRLLCRGGVRSRHTGGSAIICS
jgi:hypothetical protein